MRRRASSSNDGNDAGDLGGNRLRPTADWTLLAAGKSQQSSRHPAGQNANSPTSPIVNAMRTRSDITRQRQVFWETQPLYEVRAQFT